jgi:hypothetical protein
MPWPPAPASGSSRLRRPFRPEVARAFGKDRAVNEALRLVIRLTNTRRARQRGLVP